MPLVYKVRDNDIADSRLELEDSIVNSLAVFFDILPDKMQYEIKLVSSITTADGTTQKGTSQKVKIGTYANGNPRYKTVVNKFAVMDVYLVIPGQARKKLTRLVLAPVNILKYNPSYDDLQTFGNSVPILVKVLIQQNPAAPTQPTQVVTPTTTQPSSPTGTTPVVTNNAATPERPGANATTLSEWYQALGQTLPSVGSRAILYQDFELGPASTYVGTIEQNNKLLAALKAGVQATVKAPAVDSGWRFYKQGEYLEILPWAGNIPFGYTPITKEEYLTQKAKMLAENPTRWKPYFDQFKDNENKALTGGPSGYTIVDGVPWLTASLNQEQIYEQAVKDGKMKKVPIGNGFGYIAI